MRDRGKTRDKRDIEKDIPVQGDLVIAHANSEIYGRMTRIAQFHLSGAADQPPLPPLHDAEISWMDGHQRIRAE
jgi:hypothetical protein